jgi:hypothetical protein
MELSIVGPNKSIKKDANGIYLGGSRYMYTWIEPFYKDNVGKHRISIRNLHPDASGGEVSSSDNVMEVVYANASVSSEPKAVGDVNYLPVLFVTQDKGADQSFSAEVLSPEGRGDLTIRLSGEDKHKQATMSVTELGEGRYRYDYKEHFDASNAGKSYLISLDYQLNGKSYALFDDHIMQVALDGMQPQPIWEPKLLLDYDTTVYVPAGGRADQLIHATVNYTESGGILKMNVFGPNMNYSDSLSGKALGGSRYLYEAKVPFDNRHINGIYTIAMAFNHSSLPDGDYRFADRYMRVLERAAGSRPGAGPTSYFNDSTVTVIGRVSPEVGVIQSWDEKDGLHALTYTLRLENWTSNEAPWMELSVRPAGYDWKLVGGKKRYNSTAGSVSWTLKPFWETPFLGMAEFRFLIDGAETRSFEGPNIIAVVSDADDRFSGKLHIFEASVNASQNVTVCLVGGDSSLPENIKNWTVLSQCQEYRIGEGDKRFKWQIPDVIAPPYYDFDIQLKQGALNES